MMPDKSVLRLPLDPLNSDSDAGGNREHQRHPEHAARLVARFTRNLVVWSLVSALTWVAWAVVVNAWDQSYAAGWLP